jgi:hypothetical protein
VRKIYYAFVAYKLSPAKEINKLEREKESN